MRFNICPLTPQFFNPLPMYLPSHLVRFAQTRLLKISRPSSITQQMSSFGKGLEFSVETCPPIDHNRSEKSYQRANRTAQQAAQRRRVQIRMPRPSGQQVDRELSPDGSDLTLGRAREHTAEQASSSQWPEHRREQEAYRPRDAALHRRDPDPVQADVGEGMRPHVRVG